ncbi:hypothetical protein [Cupriavidus sp. CuC1]|uniref:hypothetical protein n=1 Tax=Cupriavidus sp. CuC1 TaxID=3373131 RepID=UPI0037CE8F75
MSTTHGMLLKKGLRAVHGQREGLRRDDARRHLAGLQVAYVARQHELALERQEAQQVAQPARAGEGGGSGSGGCPR